MKYTNPILPGFNPDPSICRVGGDYYLVTSSFEYFPGIPVYHSRDLVNWTLIGNCIHRPEQLPLDQAAPGMGIWAPTIRWHEGRFYVTAKEKNFGNFIVSAEDPAGPWSDPVRVDIGGIDPSILFDGGKAYYCTNDRAGAEREAISLVEIDPDTGMLLSPIRAIWHGVTSWRPQYIEAPHIYHIGDWYYLITAEGGTGYEHCITCARSRNIWGPYEDCPHVLLCNVPVGDTGTACAGHGDIVQAEDGSWWCVHLATRPDDAWYSHLGRETFLLPMTWENEWPVIGDGKSRVHMDGPLWAEQMRPVSWAADLTRLQPEWLFLRLPEIANYAFAQDGLTLTPSPVKISGLTGSPTMLCVRPLDIDCTVEADMTFAPLQEGDEAGVTMYLSAAGYICLGVKRLNGRNMLCVTCTKGGPRPLPIPAPGTSFTLRVEAEKTCYRLCAAGEDGVFCPVVTIPVLSRAEAGKCFTGTLFGVYAQCDTPTEARAKITRFTMTRA